MTPEAFVHLIEPHLPIGRYTGIRYCPDSHKPSTRSFTREIHLSRRDGNGSHFDIDDAASILLGEVVAEGYAFGLGRSGAAAWGWTTVGGEMTVCDLDLGSVGILEAALRSRARRNDVRCARPMMPNPDTEPHR